MTPSALPDLISELKKRVRGDLRTDAYSQIMYATDASIYRVPPLAVLIPRNDEDVQAAVETAARFRIPLLARGAGTSLAGQAVNAALIVDMSRHLDRILEINTHERWVRAQPGVVLDSLNLQLAEHGLQFGPDPASSNRATLGGIVSNNSTGSHSIVYGMTADHVLETSVYLSDGSAARFSALTEDQWEQKKALPGLEGDIYRRVDRIRRRGEETIRAGTPRHWRRCGGYNLDRLIEPQTAGPGATRPSYRLDPPNPRNLSSLVCGSEGTLAVIREVKLNLAPIPPEKALAVMHFSDLESALSAVPRILESDPSAVELLDHVGLTRSRTVPAYARLLRTFIEGDPYCVLITEFTAGSEPELRARFDALRRLRVGDRTVELFAPEAQAGVWQVRKAGLGFLMSVKGDFKPVPFIEDAAVPVEHLAEYIRHVESFCRTIGTEVGYYAHASAGCLHVRPLINTKSAREVLKMPAILEFSAVLLGEYGGALSSEHGDGRARSWLNKQFFGEGLYTLFEQTKAAFDPKHILNPGNIVAGPAMTDDLRFGPGYETIAWAERLDFSEDLGFARAVEMCNGAGICRKRAAGTMCPSFMVTREEEHSTRGRANALRAALSGELPAEEWGGDRLYEVMDLCIECKACKSECPSGVDMAKIKFEYLARYYETRRIPPRARLFAGIAAAGRLAAGPWAPLVNAALRAAPVRWGLARFLGISRRRKLPPFARRPFATRSRQAERVGERPEVLLFADTVNNFNHPETLRAAFEVLDAAGHAVHVHAQGCCGRPMISKGLHAQAARAAAETVAGLYPYAERGLPIVVLEPSCLSALKDDYAYLLPGDPRVASVAGAARSVETFVMELADRGLLALDIRPLNQNVLLHGHCHQKALFGTEDTRRMLALVAAQVEEVDSGCCGMAGSFGYEAEHEEISRRMGERRLFPAVRSHAGLTAAPGVSCRAQIAAGTGMTARHPIEILRDTLAIR